MCRPLSWVRKQRRRAAWGLLGPGAHWTRTRRGPVTDWSVSVGSVGSGPETGSRSVTRGWCLQPQRQRGDQGCLCGFFIVERLGWTEPLRWPNLRGWEEGCRSCHGQRRARGRWPHKNSPGYAVGVASWEVGAEQWERRAHRQGLAATGRGAGAGSGEMSGSAPGWGTRRVCLLWMWSSVTGSSSHGMRM